MLAHLNAIKESRGHLPNAQRMQRIQFIFDQFSVYLIGTITDQYSMLLRAIMKQILRSILIVEKLDE
jgi:hypothetical protein